MSEPESFSELKALAMNLPKNVLVPAAHIHSLLDEAEKACERIADLERQLAEKQAEIEAMRPLFTIGLDNARQPMASPYNKELARKYLARKQP